MASNLMTALVLLVANSALFLPSLACPYCQTPTVTPPPPPSPPPPAPCPPPPAPKVSPPAPKVSPPSPKAPPSAGACPIDTLKLDACVDLLSGLVHSVIGQSAKSKCCPVIEGLADLDAALCLCTTIKAKALDVKVLLPIALELLIDCGKHVPSDYQCPA
ncbi:36.4 kDa proline-rich protein-like [Zingiber officinale]|uniref:36.4 kDa proline-rich protein-like n=1 Tax=Zingiber officinale TaxID=94328 RepID=UPI001C4DC17F|nr:36.4 kDa proline-rich protein-like [Zingiber officinale]